MTMVRLRRIAKSEFGIVPGQKRKAELIHEMREEYWRRKEQK